MVTKEVVKNNQTVRNRLGSTWVAQSVKQLTLDFNLGHDLRVVRLNPMLGPTSGSVLSGESA